MITIATGVSDHPDIQQAVTEVVNACQSALDGESVQVGLLFTSRVEADFRVLLNAFSQAFPGVQIIGCTTDGDIAAGPVFIEDAVSLMLLSSESIQFSTAIATKLSHADGSSIKTAYDECVKKLGCAPVMGMIFPDGLSTIGIALDKAINDATNGTVPFFGGTAADAYTFKGTYQFCNGEVYQDSAPMLLIGGDVELSYMSRIGVEPMGRAYAIENVKKNIVSTIDGKKAATFYEELLGEYAFEQQASQFPLAVYEEGKDDFILRVPLSVEKETGDVVFVGNFPEESQARFVSFDLHLTMEGADEVNAHLLNSGTPELVFVFSCTSRKLVLGSDTKKELERLVKANVPFFGFYGYGEIGPKEVDDSVEFQSKAYVAVGLYPKQSD